MKWRPICCQIKAWHESMPVLKWISCCGYSRIKTLQVHTMCNSLLCTKLHQFFAILYCLPTPYNVVHNFYCYLVCLRCHASTIMRTPPIQLAAIKTTNKFYLEIHVHTQRWRIFMKNLNMCVFMTRCMFLIASSPGHSEILSRSRGEKSIFLHGCEIKSGSGLGKRLYSWYSA